MIALSYRKVTVDGMTRTARTITLPQAVIHRMRAWPRRHMDTDTITAEAKVATPEKGVAMAGQITLTDQEARALSSLLERASDRLATYEEQTHQDRRLAEEIREAAGDLVNRISRAGSTA